MALEELYQLADGNCCLLDLRCLEGWSIEQCLGYLKDILNSKIQPEALFLPLDAQVAEHHPDVIEEVLDKLQGSLTAVTLSHYSLRARKQSAAATELAVLGAVLRLPRMQRLRLFSAHNCGERGVAMVPNFEHQHINGAGLTALDLRCSATYFNEAAFRLVRIHRNTLKQVRLPERPSRCLLRALAQCREVESLGVPDLRLITKLERSLGNVREVLVTSMSTARRRRLGITLRAIRRSVLLQNVEHISLEERFWADVSSLAFVCRNLQRLTLRGFSHYKLSKIKSALLEFPSLHTVRLFHCEVQGPLIADLKWIGITVEVICRRLSSPGIIMKTCKLFDCDSCMENTEDLPFEKRRDLEEKIMDILKQKQPAEHKKPFLLTSSKFAPVCTRRDSTMCHNLVKEIVFPAGVGDIPAVKWARSEKKKALEIYCRAHPGNGNIKPGRLFVREDIPFLGATPDALVGEEGVVKIKFFPSLKITMKNAIIDPAMCRKLGVFCDLAKGTTLQVEHRFHYHVQGILSICQKAWCDLVLHGMEDQIVVRIYRDEPFWANKMLPFLERFHRECLLPELADSRLRRGLPAREPQYVLRALGEESKRIKSSKQEENLSYIQYYDPFVTAFPTLLIAAY